MKKKIDVEILSGIIVLLILAAFVFGSVIGCKKTTREKENWYPMGGVIIELSQPIDTVTVRDFNGNLWQFKGIEDLSVGDCVAMIMDSKGTPLIKDDEIVRVRYDGWLEGWQK